MAIPIMAGWHQRGWDHLNRSATYLVVSLILTTSGLISRVAMADSGDVLYKRGVDLRKQGKDTEALETFKSLMQVEASPRASAQVGLAEQALGSWVAAESDLVEALRSSDDRWIRKNRKALEQALTAVRERIGRLEVWGEPAGAEVLLDGKIVGTLPLATPIHVVAGQVPVTVRARGFLTRTTVVNITPNHGAREQFVLQRASASPGDAESTGHETQASSAAHFSESSGRDAVGTETEAAAELSSSPEDRSARPQSKSPGALHRRLKWMAWGAGAVALGAGGYFYSLQRQRGTDFNHSCYVATAGMVRSNDGTEPTQVSCLNLRDNFDRAFRLEVVGFIAAGALAATGFVLWGTESGAEQEEQRSALRCVPGIERGLASLGCLFVF